MFERFTDRARQSILESQAEAIEHELDFIGTEQLLLGLLRVGSGVAFEVLRSDGAELTVVREKVIAHLTEVVDPDRGAVSKTDALAAIGIDLGSVKASVEAAFGPGALPDLGSTPRYTPLAKAALEGSLHHAQILRHRYIGTEHVLLGLLDDPNTVAAAVLADLGVDLARLAARVVELVAPAEVRVDAAFQAITRLQMSMQHVVGATGDELAVTPVLAELSAALGRALSDEQGQVARLANDAALTLEQALADARTRIDSLGLAP